jgi:hypothetical protein
MQCQQGFVTVYTCVLVGARGGLKMHARTSRQKTLTVVCKAMSHSMQQELEAVLDGVDQHDRPQVLAQQLPYALQNYDAF